MARPNEKRDLETFDGAEAKSVRFSASATTVEAWTPHRLRFDHIAPWQRHFRQELCRLLKQLDGHAGRLYARLTTEDKTGDLENILFYNVGTACFAPLKLRQVEFERVTSEPPSPAAAGCFTHHHLYSVELQPGGVQPTEVVVSMPPIIVARPKNALDCAPYWITVREALLNGRLKVLTTGTVSGRLGIDVTLEGPWRSALLDLTKPLIDGLLAALGPHVNLPAGAVAALASRAGRSVREIECLLTNGYEVLAGRPVLHGRGTGVQFNPADDRLIHASLAILPNDSGGLVISGRLYRVRAGA